MSWSLSNSFPPMRFQNCTHVHQIQLHFLLITKNNCTLFNISTRLIRNTAITPHMYKMFNVKLNVSPYIASYHNYDKSGLKGYHSNMSQELVATAPVTFFHFAACWSNPADPSWTQKPTGSTCVIVLGQRQRLSTRVEKSHQECQCKCTNHI